jgi:ABC-type uncharacterized transport system involved in gliding motility auxiliary subunit
MPKIIGLVSLALLLALFLGVNITADRALAGARLDLTEGRLYTIRDATKRIARSPDEPVRLTFYYSRDLARGIPQIESFGRRVGEMLGAIAASSNGRVVLETVNPEPFSEAEDEAVAEGIQPQPVSQTENLYFGLVATNSLDGRETIPLFRPQEERFLEYRVAQLIAKLAEPDKPTLGLLTGLPMTGGFDPRTQRPTPEWAVLRELGATFEVETIPPTAAELPGGLDALMIVHPKDLPESLVYSIDQYILGGGGAIVFVDPVAESEQVAQQMGMPMGQDRSSDLPDLFGAWGVAYDRTQLVGDLDLAISVRAPGPRQDIVPYIVWLNAGAEQMDADDPVTGNLSRLNIATAGAFSPAENAPASLTPLVSTTAQSAFVPATSVQGFPDPASMLNDFFPDGETRTIAGRITGTVPSAFPDGPPAGDTAEENTDAPDGGEPADTPAAGHLAESSGPINVVVVADTDILEDGGWVRELRLGGALLGYDLVADNGAFAVNAAEQMAGNRDLLALRGRGSFSRPFTLIERMQREADAEFRAREQTLEEEIEQASQRINDLQMARTDTGVSTLVLTPEQQAEVDALRETILEKRKELRQVQLNLREDIESLETRLKVINTAGVPVLLSVLALSMGGYRAVRRRADRRRGSAR